MSRIVRGLIAVLLATVTMGTLASVARATGTISNSTGSTVLTATSMTLRDNSIGIFTGSATFTATLRTGDIACDATNGVTIGGIRSASIGVISPAGRTASATNLPWPVTTRCSLSSGSIELLLTPSLSINYGVFGTYAYTGSMTGRLNAAGTAFSGTSSSLSSDRGSTLSFLIPWAFTTSPAILWRLL